jgi:hypothetical protein
MWSESTNTPATPATVHFERETLVIMRQFFLVAEFRQEAIHGKPEVNLLKNESADENVSGGQMRDQIVAIGAVFLQSRP